MKIFYKRLQGDINAHAYFVSNYYLEQALKSNNLYTNNIEEADIIYAQENVGGLELFKKYPEKVKIVQLVCSHPDFYCKIYREELDKYKMEDVRPFNWAPVRKAEIDLADYIVVYSKFTKKTCIDAGIPGKKVIVIPKGVETGFFQPKNPESKWRKFTVGYAGQLQLIKGVHYIPLTNDYKTIMAGEKTQYLDKKGNRSWQFKRLMGQNWNFANRKEGLIDLVDHGKLTKAEMVDFYNICDVMVAPSLEDSFNMCVLEALSCGVPVITTKNTGAGELITHHKEGSIVPIRDTMAIYKEIKYWMDHKATPLGCAPSTSCRELALKHSMDTYMNDIIKFLKEVKKNVVV